ncbi:class I SAM-dependent methyltransferase [Aeromonas allosaccharophila]|uniref:class I SAM-dependent methyltransferase n=1 Tax=Aeromonas allosaccharophila TaxID=656 RepID=UPI002AE08259|nr:class I SAM-dependent methyltransferase [Aeromonas allosaccharophila]
MMKGTDMVKSLDVFGKALQAHYLNRGDEILQINMTGENPYCLPLSIFFRPADYYQIDRLALSLCRGKILDIGAGTGEHTLFLQQLWDVTALDISPLACEVMRERGIRRVINADIFSANFDSMFDTWLLLGRSIGAVGNVEMLREFFKLAYKYISPNGQIILNSTGGSANQTIIRELSFTFKGETEGPINWLDIGQDHLTREAGRYGFSTEIVKMEKDGNYLGVLKK